MSCPRVAAVRTATLPLATARVRLARARFMKSTNGCVVYWHPGEGLWALVESVGVGTVRVVTVRGARCPC